MSTDIATVVLVALMASLAAAMPFTIENSKEIYEATTKSDNATSSLACPPGFMLQANSCVCADWPNAMITCNDESQVASIQLGYCMTYDNDTGEVIAGMCRMWNLQTNYSRLYYQLPERWSDLNEIVCKSYHSTGTLCGECNVQDGYGPATMTYTAAHCVKCSYDLQHWVRFLASTFLPLTLILTFI